MQGSQLGAFGGRALARINTSPKPFFRGEPIDAETILSWPIANRRALQKAGRVEFYPAPTEPKQPNPAASGLVAGPEYGADFGIVTAPAPAKPATGSGRYSKQKE